jgi:DNA-directed RNA polymerase specialized sigma24 family protein
MKTDVDARRETLTQLRRVVVMREVDGLKFREIGAALGVGKQRAAQIYQQGRAYVHNAPQHYLLSALVNLLRK